MKPALFPNRRCSLFVSVAVLAALALNGLATRPGEAQTGGRPPAAPLARRPLAPEFPPGAAWLNTERPLTLRGLRGKIVLLDFWTYGCINCMHILPDLKRLERKYASELVVISVHTAKFVNEDETANIRNAVLRYNIQHPILNDSGRRYWTAMGVNIWPTQVLIDPTGRVVGGVAGEGRYAELDRAIGQLSREARAAGRLDTRPVRFALEAARAPKTDLSYPGKVLADLGADGSGRIYIADSNHNRIVIADANGKVEAVAGNGRMGREDGAFQEATFSSPQGMALRRHADGSQTLYVADTNNHVIRALDLKRGRVTTVAGTGRQGSVTRRSAGGVGTEVALASPWDLLLVGNTLYIAMAGPHQIWSMNLDTSRIRPYAGSGKEAREDGPLLFSAFAQPSGLATDGKRLFVADSESSSLRAVDLPGGGGRVQSLTHGDLFAFGDRDGPGLIARLQHPLAVAYRSGSLYIADTYNHKLKRFDLSEGTVETFLGGGKGGRESDPARFYEPGGLSLAGDRLYVADTNNHRVCVVDIRTRKSTVLALKNLPAPLTGEPQRSSSEEDEEKETLVLPQAILAPSGAGELVVEIQLPAGHKLAKETPHRFEAQVEGGGVTLTRTTVPSQAFTLPLRLPLTSGSTGARGAVLATMTFFYCSEKDGVCKMKSLRIRAPFEVREGGAKELKLTTSVK